VFFRKSQITAFIIIGIILIISAFALIYIKSLRSPSGNTLDLLSIPNDDTSMKQYVEGCIKKVTPGLLPEIARNGGLSSIKDDQEGIFIWYNNDKFRIYCNHVEGLKSCQNAFVTRQEIEAEIENSLPPLMESCLNFEGFRQKGVKVETGPMNFDVKLGTDDLTVTLDYPITMTIKDNVLKVNNYYARVESHLGFLYDLAVSITNEEIEKGLFDKESWMVDNNVFVNIEKHRPYPNIVYSLKKADSFLNESLDFRFSIQGQDTSLSVGSSPGYLSSGKDCVNNYDGICFNNVAKESCLEKKGQVTRCNNEFIVPKKQQDCNGHPCKPCIVNGNETSHGSSWCLYDSVQKINSYGLSYVGSRDFLQSCIDGEVVTEDCRDFREELCTQNVVNQKSKGMCRVNRWQDCPFCTTESCCMDESRRDCQWDDRMYKYLDNSRVDIQFPDRKCFPKVPPGFRFWDGYGMDVCSMGTQYAYCKGWGACPGSYVDDSALYCLRLGDCGNSRNIADKLTKTGFFNSDPNDRVSNFIYLGPGLNKDPVSQLGLEPITSNIYATNQQLLVHEYPESIEVLPALMQQAVLYLKYVKKISPDPFTLASLDPKVLEYSFCTVWSPPEGSEDCSLCSADPIKPCSEYRCKSLGKYCKFESEKGVGSCVPVTSEHKDPPKITFDESSLQQGFRAEAASINPAGHVINGFKITPGVKPYLPFSFGVNTDEPARCKLTFIPVIDYAHLPAIWIGGPKYTTSHKIFLRLPREITVPPKVYKYLDISSLSEIADKVTNLENTYEEYKQKYKTEISLFESLKGIDVIAIADKAVKLVLDTINPFLNQFPFIKELSKIMLSNFENSNYMLFVKCIDEAGNENTQEFFVQFAIDVNSVDDAPPQFIASIPKNESEIASNSSSFGLKYFINEPAECRFSLEDRQYELMNYTLSCPSDPYNVSFMYSGSYECSSAVPFAKIKNSTKVFVRCLDNPVEVDKYSINFIKSKNFSNDLYSPPYLETVAPNVVNVDANLLNGISVNVNVDTVDLNIYVDDDMNCQYASNYSPDLYAPFSACVQSNKTNVGLFKCSALVPSMHNASGINIECSKKALPGRNVNQKSTVLYFTRSKEFLDLLAEGSNINDNGNFRSNGETITTNSIKIGIVLKGSISERNILCGYFNGTQEMPSTQIIAMTKYNDFSYEADLSTLSEGPHQYTIKCWDEFGNEIKKDVNFIVKTA